MQDRISLSKKDARKLFWDVLASNILFAMLLVCIIVITPWLWVKIVAGFFIINVIFHTLQVKKVLIVGKLFSRKRR